MRYLIYRLINLAMALLPVGLSRRFLRAFYVHPDLATRAGYVVYPQGFWNPFPNPAEVDLAKLKVKRELPGIDLQTPAALQLVRELSAFSAEVAEFQKNRTGDVARWDGTYPPCDSATLYAMLRHFKPKRYIEVGCGYSSRSSVAALNKNRAEGHPCQALFVEPYPAPHLAELKLPGEFLQKKIQEAPLAPFQELDAGDVLFIDTSHVIKVQNDVEHELIHILPLLKPGVIVHVHDIFTPYDYPAEWLVGDSPNHGGNNEQYALECLLSGGRDWEVLLPVYLLWREQPEALRSLYYSEHRPAAFWIKKTTSAKSA